MEIERKYLVDPDKWKVIAEPADASFIQQAYLSMEPNCTVRLRIVDNKGFLTIKGKSEGLSRAEYEYPIPMMEGLEIMKMADSPMILKNRYQVRFQGFLWEVDVFLGENQGLVMAEVELENESVQPPWPEWVLSEVTGDARYYNSSLAVKPFCKGEWKQEEGERKG